MEGEMDGEENNLEASDQIQIPSPPGQEPPSQIPAAPDTAPNNTNRSDIYPDANPIGEQQSANSSDIGSSIHFNSPAPLKKHSFWKIFLSILGIIILLIILSGIYLRYLLNHGRDAKKVNDSELQLNVINLPDTLNAYPLLVQAQKVIYYPTTDAAKIGDLSSNKNWDDKYVKNLLAKNQQALSYFDQASIKTEYQDPTYNDPSAVTYMTMNPNLKSYRNMMRLKEIQNYWEYRQGNKSKALSGALLLTDIGYKMKNSQADIMHYLVASVIYKAGLNQMNGFLDGSKYDRQDLDKALTSLEKYKSQNKGLMTAEKMEYLSQSKIIDSIAMDLRSGKTPNATDSYSLPSIESYPKQIYYFEPNKTKQLFADNTKNLINHIAEPCAKYEKPKKFAVPKSKIKKIFSENMIGIILTDMVVESGSSLLSKECESRQLLNQVIAKTKK